MIAKKYSIVAVCFLIVVFPLSALFFDLSASFTSDWYNSLFLAGYAKKYFTAHHFFPVYLNSEEFIGNHFPAFYGYLFYPVLGLLSLPGGVHLGVRLLALILFVLQFGLVSSLFRKYKHTRFVSIAMGALISWSIYPLTNLYHRSALPECFATVLLFCAAACWFHVLLASEPVKRNLFGVGFALCSLFLAGFHAITAYYGLLFLAAVVGVSTVLNYRRLPGGVRPIVKLASLSAVFVTIGLSPWLYLCWSLKDSLVISGSLGRLIYHHGIDEWWIRFFPMPMDWRSVVGGISTPTFSLDAQINGPLLVVFLFSLVEGWRSQIVSKTTLWAASVCAVLFLLNTYISVTPRSDLNFISYINHFQIAYRMVTYSNFLIFLGLCFLAHYSSHFLTTSLLLVVVTWSAMGIGLKLSHAVAIFPEGERFGYERFLTESDEEFLKIPTSFYSFNNYEISRGSSWNNPAALGATSRIAFSPDKGRSFGAVESITLNLEKPSFILTNVAAFPWNHLELNGKLVPVSETRGIVEPKELGLQKIPVNPETLAFRIDEPGRHVIRFVHRADPTYLLLRKVSAVTIGLALIYFLATLLGTMVPRLAFLKRSYT